MLADHHLSKLVAAIAVAALAAVLAGPSALAASKRSLRAIPGACAATSTCTTVAVTQPTIALACAAATSPYPGWVSITDDTGVAWLYPGTQYDAQTGRACVLSQSTAAAADAPAPAAPASADPPVSPSPYPGWVFVVDDQGVPWLEPVAVPGSLGR